MKRLPSCGSLGAGDGRGIEKRAERTVVKAASNATLLAAPVMPTGLC